jgi:predicted DNA-binding transcriptional regulator YafY
MHQAVRPPLARIVTIDQAIRAGRWPNASTLAQELEVSPRTVQRDLTFLRDRLGAPVEFDIRQNGYRYSHTDFRLPFFRLSEGELVALFLADRLLRQYRGTPFESDLRRAFGRICDMLPEAVTIDLAALPETLSVMPAVVAEQDLEIFRLLSSAMTERRCLEIAYWSASNNAITRRRIDPYHLTLIDGGWYVIGHCHLRKDLRMFAVHRVRKAKETGETFDRPNDFNVADYLDGSFRALRGVGQHHVLLRFSTNAAKRVAEKKWHATQTTEPTPDGGLVLRLQLNDLREVKRWVLGWGSDCEVLEPQELLEMMRDELVLMGKTYFQARP